MSNTSLTVHTQAEADAAFQQQARQGPEVTITIASTAGVWIAIPDGGRVAVHRGGRVDVNDGGRVDVNRGGWADVHDGGWAAGRAASTLNLRSGATAHAGTHTAVFLHSQNVTLDGDGHIIDLTAIDLNDPTSWCDYNGVKVADGTAHVYKAVDQNYRSHHGTYYPPGSTPEAADWNTDQHCGHGLHFGATPTAALHAAATSIERPRFLLCGVRLDEIVCLGDKVKARRVTTPCIEVDRAGDPIDTKAAIA